MRDASSTAWARSPRCPLPESLRPVAHPSSPERPLPELSPGPSRRLLPKAPREGPSRRPLEEAVLVSGAKLGESTLLFPNFAPLSAGTTSLALEPLPWRWSNLPSAGTTSLARDQPPRRWSNLPGPGTTRPEARIGGRGGGGEGEGSRRGSSPPEALLSHPATPGRCCLGHVRISLLPAGPSQMPRSWAFWGAFS